MGPPPAPLNGAKSARGAGKGGARVKRWRDRARDNARGRRKRTRFAEFAQLDGRGGHCPVWARGSREGQEDDDREAAKNHEQPLLHGLRRRTYH